MLNRKMVFRVTKSQSMKDKLSFIWYYMIILTGGWRVGCVGGGGGGWGGNIHGFSGGLSANEWKYLNERDHKIYTASQTMGGQVNFFFPTWKVVPGAYSDQRQTVPDTWNTPKKWFFWPKEAERGWKSGATPLSWKSRWKPSTREEFWHQRI